MRKILGIALFLCGCSFAYGQEEPNQQTLKRLAQQLGAGKTSQLDPETMKWAQEFFKNNPNIQDDPAFKKLKQDMQQKMEKDPEGFMKMLRQDPNGLAQQLKQENPDLTQQQLDNFKNSIPKPAPSQVGQAPTPIATPKPALGQGQGQNPNPATARSLSQMDPGAAC